MKRVFCLLLAGFMLLALGCDDLGTQASAKKPKKPTAKKVVKKKPKKEKQKQIEPDPGEEIEIITRAFNNTSLTSSGYTGSPEDAAVKKATRAINASLELGPTLVVWIIDRTPSSQRMATSAAAAAAEYYDSAEIREAAKAGDTLTTAIVGYDEKVEFVLEPTADVDQVRNTIGALQPATGGREMTFTAIKETLQKYLPLRTDQRREIVLIVVTDEAGDDQANVDDVIKTAREGMLPIYVVGVPAPWGQVNPFAEKPKAIDQTGDDSKPTYGPESLYSERVDVHSWQSGAGYAASQTALLIDSGFGPFALERLCRATGGQFLAARPDSSGDWAAGGYQSTMWPSPAAMQFEPDIAAKYAPDYVSEGEYKKLLSENKARNALYQAAQLEMVRVTDIPTTQFAKTDEAQMKRTLDRAQQFAAKNSPNIDKLYDALVQGEGDREKLKSPRLQAEYDLAMGRVLALKARIDGYNSMIAALKRGKNFTNAGSTTWVLAPAEATETESTLRKMGERAKMYLKRVVDEHPGTPWAKLAEEELAAPVGWTWQEA